LLERIEQENENSNSERGKNHENNGNRPYRLPAGYLRSLHHTPDGVETRLATLKLFDGLPY
jgi:hypothetical protein